MSQELGRPKSCLSLIFIGPPLPSPDTHLYGLNLAVSRDTLVEKDLVPPSPISVFKTVRGTRPGQICSIRSPARIP